jgi:hypothetical protein
MINNGRTSRERIKKTLLWNTTLTALIEQMHGEIGEMIQKEEQQSKMRS